MTSSHRPNFITEHPATVESPEGIDDDYVREEDQENPSRKTLGRRKIEIEFIHDKNKRHISFSKRKAGIMKKAFELFRLTGSEVFLLIASDSGVVFTFSTPKLEPIIDSQKGKNFVRKYLCGSPADSPAEASPSSSDTSRPLKRHKTDQDLQEQYYKSEEDFRFPHPQFHDPPPPPLPPPPPPPFAPPLPHVPSSQTPASATASYSPTLFSDPTNGNNPGLIMHHLPHHPLPAHLHSHAASSSSSSSHHPGLINPRSPNAFLSGDISQQTVLAPPLHDVQSPHPPTSPSHPGDDSFWYSHGQSTL